MMPSEAMTVIADLLSQHQRNTKLVQIVAGARNAHFIAEIFWGKTFWVAELGACNRILG
jgi:hypothetical protein